MSVPSTDRPQATADRRRHGDVDIDRLRLVLLRLARCIRTSSGGHITPSQLAVLASIAAKGPLTIGQIADAERVKPPSASKIVATLESLGLVERTVDPTDRRCMPIVVSEAGIGHLDGVRAAGRSWLAARMATMDADDTLAIEAALPALERLLGVAE